MSRRNIENLLIFVILVLIIIIALILPAHGAAMQPMSVYSGRLPKPPMNALEYSIFRTGPFEVAKVFGRSQACMNADFDLIQFTSDAAATAGLDPRIAASIIATESGCNQFAVSSRGALGLMQVMANTWKSRFDFGGDINLLNRKDNIKVGVTILADLVRNYGVLEGTRRYNGLGVLSADYDASYTNKVLTLARGK